MKRLLRFGLTGGLATAVHLGVALALVSGAGWALWPANVIAYLSALLVSYFGHALWVFGQRPLAGNFMRYLLVNSVSLLIISALSWLAEHFSLDHRLAVVLIATSVPLSSYVLHSRYTFAPGARQ